MKPLILFLLFMTLSLDAHAQRNGYNLFPQFRNLSGLAGGGYGVDIEGYGSLSGPTAYSTPTAYVLGHDQFRGGVAQTSGTIEPRDLFPANGTTIGTFGHTFGRLNVAVSDMLLSAVQDQAFNVQFQYIPDSRARWAGSIGLQDIGGGGGSSGTGEPGDGHSSRSFFGVVTYRWDTPRSPVFLSAGIGTRRFGHPFESASWQALERVRLWIENDGLGTNEGILYTYRLGRGRRATELTALIGAVDTSRLTLEVGVGFSIF